MKARYPQSNFPTVGAVPAESFRQISRARTNGHAARRIASSRRSPRISTIAILLSLGFLLTACFEYEEKVIFHGDFSGIIEFHYTVPVHEKSSRSLIAFLPSRPVDIRARYASRSLSPELQDFKMERLPGDPYPLARVSYRIRFSHPRELEAYLPGDVQIFQGGNTLRLYRSLPGLESGQEGRQIRVYRLAYRSIVEKLKGRTMKFSISCPWYYDILSNQGTLPAPGAVFFQFPLERTVMQQKETQWNVEIKANPAPEEEMKKAPAPPGRAK